MNTKIAGLVLGLAAFGFSGAADAGGDHADKAQWKVVRDAPVKDCTRLNGRFGYYGNPWCTPAEQARWDRWTARQKWVR